MNDLKRRKKTQTTSSIQNINIYTHTQNFTFMLLLALIIMLCGIRSLSAAKFIFFILNVSWDNSIFSSEASDMVQLKFNINLGSGRMLQNIIDFYLSES